MKFEVNIILKADSEASFFEAMGNPSEDLLIEVKRALRELDDVTVEEIEVETVKD